MKKFLLSLLCAVISVGAAWADTADFSEWSGYTWTKSGDDFTGKVGDFTFLLTKGSSSTALVEPDAASIRVYAGANLTITAPEGYLMTEVSGLTASSNKALGTTVNTGWTNETGTITATANQAIKFTSTTGQNTITFDGDGKQLRVKSLTITYSKSDPTKKDAGLSFPQAEYPATIGEAFTKPELTKATTAAVEYASSNEKVATVDAATGEVTLVHWGETTITATAPAEGDFNAGSASYTIHVEDPNATDVTFDFLKNDYGLPNDGNAYVENNTTISNDIVKMTLTKGSGSGFRYWTDGLRIYSGNASITVSAENAIITSVIFKVKAAVSNIKESDTELAYDSKALTYTWTGSAAAPVFVITASSTKAIESIQVVYSSQADPGKGKAELSYATTNVTANLADKTLDNQLTNPHNLAVTYTSSNPEVATVAADGKVTLVGVGTTTITAASEETAEYNAGSAFYTITVVKSYESVSDFYTVGKGNAGVIGFKLTVTYVNGANVYCVSDNSEATLIYKSNLGLNAGDVIPAGWEGTYSPFYGLPEIVPTGTLPAVTETADVPAPAELTNITEADVNKIVILKNVVFAAATLADKASFTGTITPEIDAQAEGDSQATTITFYNNFKTASVAAGTYDVKAAVSLNNGNVQAYPIEYTEVIPTGIDGIEAVDENAPVEYYNLQGVRVAEPTPGLYIRRQGGKISKVIVK